MRVTELTEAVQPPIRWMDVLGRRDVQKSEADGKAGWEVFGGFPTAASRFPHVQLMRPPLQALLHLPKFLLLRLKDVRLHLPARPRGLRRRRGLLLLGGGTYLRC